MKTVIAPNGVGALEAANRSAHRTPWHLTRGLRITAAAFGLSVQEVHNRVFKVLNTSATHRRNNALQRASC